MRRLRTAAAIASANDQRRDANELVRAYADRIGECGSHDWTEFDHVRWKYDTHSKQGRPGIERVREALAGKYPLELHDPTTANRIEVAITPRPESYAGAKTTRQARKLAAAACADAVAAVQRVIPGGLIERADRTVRVLFMLDGLHAITQVESVARAIEARVAPLAEQSGVKSIAVLPSERGKLDGEPLTGSRRLLKPGDLSRALCYRRRDELAAFLLAPRCSLGLLQRTYVSLERNIGLCNEQLLQKEEQLIPVTAGAEGARTGAPAKPGAREDMLRLWNAIVEAEGPCRAAGAARGLAASAAAPALRAIFTSKMQRMRLVLTIARLADRDAPITTSEADAVRAMIMGKRLTLEQVELLRDQEAIEAKRMQRAAKGAEAIARRWQRVELAGTVGVLDRVATERLSQHDESRCGR